jgi:radical SAM/Cys-rich protein
MSPSEEMHRLRATGIPTFESRVAEEGVSVLQVETVDILQVNLGKLCNQVCTHCHVDAGPDRTENMTAETAGQVLELLKKHPIPTLDLTGGAPELNPNFRMLVREARALGRHVLDRCNLTVLTLRSQPDLIDFLAEHQVEVVASLPSFRQAGTDTQRGDGVFVKSILALKRLNEAGYGRGNGLKLNLVYNPVGAFLPASQASLKRDYKRELAQRFDVVFDNLFTITNMPIRRYLDYLERSGNLQSYMELLAGAFNPAAAEEVMCRNYLSVGWDGQLYDCDFNQMLEMPVNSGAADTLSALLVSGELRRNVRTGAHCFGCTAGSGSSCAGSVTES